MTKLTWTHVLLVVLSVGSLSTSSARRYPRKPKKKQDAYYYQDSYGYGHGYGHTKTDYHPGGKITVEGESKSYNDHGYTHGYGGGYIKDGKRKHYASHGTYGSNGGHGYAKVNAGGTKKTDYGKTTTTSSSHDRYGKGGAYGYTYGKSKDRTVYSHGYSESKGKNVYGGSSGGGGSSNKGKLTAAYSIAGGKSRDRYGENYHAAGGAAYSKDRGSVESYSYHHGEGKSGGLSGGIGVARKKGAGALHVSAGGSKKGGYSNTGGYTHAHSDKGDYAYTYGHTETKGKAKGGTVGIAVASKKKEGSGGLAVAKGNGGHVKTYGGQGSETKDVETHTKQSAGVHGHGKAGGASVATEHTAYAGSYARSNGGHSYGSAEASSKKPEKGY